MLQLGWQGFGSGDMCHSVLCLSGQQVSQMSTWQSYMPDRLKLKIKPGGQHPQQRVEVTSILMNLPASSSRNEHSKSDKRNAAEPAPDASIDLCQGFGYARTKNCSIRSTEAAFVTIEASEVRKGCAKALG